MSAHPDGLPIGEGWVPAATADVTFPYDGSVVAQAPVGTVEDARAAIDAAVAARAAVAALPSRTRRAILLATRDALAARRGELEQVLVAESGKPLVDCRIEVDRDPADAGGLRRGGGPAAR